MYAFSASYCRVHTCLMRFSIMAKNENLNVSLISCFVDFPAPVICSPLIVEIWTPRNENVALLSLPIVDTTVSQSGKVQNYAADEHTNDKGKNSRFLIASLDLYLFYLDALHVDVAAVVFHLHFQPSLVVVVVVTRNFLFFFIIFPHFIINNGWTQDFKRKHLVYL